MHKHCLSSLRQVGVENCLLTIPSPLSLPASFWSSLLPSGFEFKFRITFSSSLSHTGKASALSYSQTLLSAMQLCLGYQQ